MPNKRPPNAEKTQFRTGSEQVEIATKGGIASGEARRKKKLFTELAQRALEMRPTPKTANLMKALGFEEDELTQKAACILGLIKEAQSGNVKAFEKLQELTGELPEESKGKDNGILEELKEYLKGNKIGGNT